MAFIFFLTCEWFLSRLEESWGAQVIRRVLISWISIQSHEWMPIPATFSEISWHRLMERKKNTCVESISCMQSTSWWSGDYGLVWSLQVSNMAGLSGHTPRFGPSSSQAANCNRVYWISRNLATTRSEWIKDASSQVSQYVNPLVIVAAVAANSVWYNHLNSNEWTKRTNQTATCYLGKLN